MSTATIVTIAKHLLSNHYNSFGVKSRTPVAISNKNVLLAKDISDLVDGHDGLNRIPDDKSIEFSYTDLYNIFYNNKAAVLKITDQLARSVGSYDTYDYIMHLTHTVPYTNANCGVFRYGSYLVKELFASKKGDTLNVEHQQMIQAIMTEVISGIRNSYFHQTDIVPF